jgi:NADH dehydrogenase FAD-containing subunit
MSQPAASCRPQGRHLVLLGAGHAHLHLLRHAARFRRAGHAVTLVAPGPFWYSGLATGMLGGRHDAAADQIDVAALAAQGGVRFVRDSATGLDRAARLVRLAAGAPLAYDALSVALGSSVAPLPDTAPEALPMITGAKPIAGLWALREALERGFRAGTGPARIVVAGGGVTGCELAANLAALVRRQGAAASVSLVCPPGELLRSLRPSAAAGVIRALQDQDIMLRQDGPVRAVRPGLLHLPEGRQLPFDLLVNASGLVPPAVLRGFGLPLDAGGALLVDRQLRSLGDPRVHGAGDCVAIAGHPLSRAGVQAVRQAPVLLHNLLAALGTTAPRAFRPRPGALWIMNLGDGTGLANYGALHWRGRPALLLKDWIDQRFMRRHRSVIRG